MDALTPPPALGADVSADAPAPTPRETRTRLNRMECWLREQTPALTDAGHGAALVRLRALFELAYTAEHADYLAAELHALRHILTADA